MLAHGDLVCGSGKLPCVPTAALFQGRSMGVKPCSVTRLDKLMADPKEHICDQNGYGAIATSVF